ncbi:MAG: hypothetical protein KDB82_08390 [Planctomycetes bacterium]|nr:hypothetical protein [Planctomycetota bacterium]
MRFPYLTILMVLAFALISCGTQRTRQTATPQPVPAEQPEPAAKRENQASAKPEDPPAETPDPPAKPESDKTWLLTGSVKLVGDRDFDLSAWCPVEGFRGTVWFQRPEDSDEAFDFVLGADGVFQVCTPKNAVSMFETTDPNSGSWSLIIEGFFHPQTEASLGLDQVRIPLQLEPSSGQREIRFRPVTVEYKSLLGDVPLVIGRLLDAEGNPVCRSPSMELVSGPEDDAQRAWLYTDSDGRFIDSIGGILNAREAGELDEIHWTLHCNGNPAEWELEDGSLMFPKPEVRRKLVDFGDVTLAGCIVRFHVKDNRPQSAAAMARWRKYVEEEQAVRAYVYSGTSNSHPTFPVPYDGSEACAWIPEGVFRYNWLGDYIKAYEVGEGVLVVPASGVLRIELPLDPLPFVGVSIDAEGGMYGITSSWEVYRAGKQVNEDYSSYDRFGVRLDEGEHAVLCVRPPDYCEHTYTIRAGDPDMRFSVPAACGVGHLKVEYPTPPEGWSYGSLDLDILVEADDATLFREVTPELLNEDKPLAVDYDGIMRISLQYDGRTVSGPVEVTIVPGSTVEVALPPIAEPGTDAWPVEWFGKSESWCGDTRVERLVGPERPLRPMSDGESEIVPEVTQPTWNERTRSYAAGKSVFRLPVRLTLNMDALRERYGADLTVTLLNVRSMTGSRSQVAEGELQLWAPPGKAELTVRLSEHPGLTVYSAIVTLSAGSTLDHVAKLDPTLRKVTFEPDPKAPNSASWDIYHETEDGQVACLFGVSRDFDGLGPFWMRPGKYYAMPDVYHADATVFHFEVGESEDQTVRLPDPGSWYSTGTIRLKFALPEGEYLESWFSSYLVRGDAASRLSADFRTQEESGSYQEQRITSWGAKLYEFSLGQEHLVVGCVWVKQNGRQVPWLIEPLLVHPTTTGQEFEVTLRRGVPLKSYADYGVVTITGWAPGFRLRPVLGLVPVGKYTLHVWHPIEGMKSWQAEIAETDETCPLPPDVDELLRAYYRLTFKRDPDD